MHTGLQRSFTDRMIGAARLDAAVYEEVEADTTATQSAAVVVVIVSIASAVGGARAGLAAMMAGLLAALIGWLIWSGITYLIGDKVLGGTATWGELLRTIGFAQSPGVLYVLGVIPVLGAPIRFAVGVWILVAVIIAIRQACDFGTGRAILTALLGFVAYVLLGVALAMALTRAAAPPL
jgi:hypothetical protein